MLKKQFSEIAQQCEITINQVEKIANFIAENLNPYPVRSKWGDVRNPQENEMLQLGAPDIILSFFENSPQKPIMIEVFQPANSNLILNTSYHAALKTVDKETKMKMREDLEKASLFIEKYLQQRTNTILRMAQVLVEIQEKYIREGDRYLKPITRAEIAKKLSVHESTISRAVSSKTIQLPNRKVYPLSVFFDRSLQIRTEIKEIVEKRERTIERSAHAALLKFIFLNYEAAVPLRLFAIANFSRVCLY